MSNSDLTDFGRDIDALLKRRGWSQRRLAEEAGIDVSNVSRIMRGLQEPSHKMVEAIADALQVDASYLKGRAGLRTSDSQAQRDPTVEYIAQRLEALPPDVREKAVDALGAQLDSIYEIVGIERPQPARSLSPEEEREALEEALLQLARRAREVYPEAIARVFDELAATLDEEASGDDAEGGAPPHRRAS